MSRVSPTSPGIPQPIDGDDDDVAWALQTAAAQWKRGAYGDAIQWLRRAVDAAIRVGDTARASQLNRTTAELTEAMLARSAAARDEGTSEAEQPDRGAPSVRPRAGASQRPSWVEVVVDEAEDPDDDGTDLIELDGPGPSYSGQAARPGVAPARPASEPEHALPPEREPSQIPAPPRRPPFAAFRARAPDRASASPPAPSVATPTSTRPPARHTGTQPASSRPRVPVARRVSTRPPSVRVEYRDSDRAVERPEGPRLEYRQSFLPEELAGLASAGAEPPVPSPEASAAPSPEASAAPSRRSAPAAARLRTEARAPAAASAPPPSQRYADTEEASPVSVGGVRLAEVAGLEDLPDEAQAQFVKKAQLVTLGVGEEVGSFAVALVVRGWVDIMPAIADCACAKAGPGQVVFTEGTLDEGIALRAVAGQTPTLVAVWNSEALTAATHDCPWVEEDLRVVADRFQALAGAVMGELGDRLDDVLRAQVTDRCELRALLPRELLFNQADQVDGMYIIGAGRIETFEARAEKSKLIDELGPGDFVFPASVLAADPAPYAARAGARGALLLYASRHNTHELMMLVPPLLEILSA